MLKGILRYHKDHRLFVCLGLLILVNLAVRLPYFLWLNVHDVAAGTSSYLEFAMLLGRGDFSPIGALPIGLPLINLVSIELFDRIYPVILLQNVLTIGSAAVLIVILHRHFPRLTLLATLLFVFHTTGSICLLFDFRHDPESIYTSLLILVMAFFIHFWLTKKAKLVPAILFGFCLMYAATMRSNGPFLYLIMLFLLGFLIRERVRIKDLAVLLLPLLFFNIVWASANLYASGLFLIGDVKRLSHRIAEDRTMLAGEPEKHLKYFTSIENRNKDNFLSLKAVQFYLYAKSLATRKTRYYGDYLQDRVLDSYYSKKYGVSGFFQGDTTIPKAEQAAAVNEFISRVQDRRPDRESKVRYALKHNIWVKLVDFYHQSLKLLYNNWGWLLVFIAALGVSIWKVIKSRFNNDHALLIACVASIPLVNAAIVTIFQGRYLLRYAYPAEPVVLIAIVLSLLVVPYRPLMEKGLRLMRPRSN